MNNEQRVVFTFDDGSLERLKEITEIGQFSSMGEAVSDSLRINHALQTQAEEGFTEIIVRNPATGQERVMVGPGARVAPRLGLGPHLLPRTNASGLRLRRRREAE